ncbi:sulfotransferase [Psychroserpens sp. S379A]|uniref:sulfotransferase n=1 Tax=Psychroserpens sp. S379A TaxID=3415137 RepID=UPI003C7DE583
MNLIHRIYNKIRRDYIVPYKIRNKPKIFGVGNNKTGTTSLKEAFLQLGYVVASQGEAERMIKKWAIRDFKSLIKFCRKSEFFQDIPFSKPYTFIALDQAFPGSKFVLTVRDTPEQWYNSITKFHAKKWGVDNKIPTKEDLKNSEYCYKGWVWEVNRLQYTTPEKEPYKKEELIKRYNDHNSAVIDYFRHRPKDLLVLNVSEEGAYKKLCCFLGVEAVANEFPWVNKT